MVNAKTMEAFKTELRSVRGLANNSVSIYAQEVQNFLNFMSEHKHRIESCTHEELIAWRESLNERADAGIALSVTAVRTFFGFLKLADRFPDFRVRIKNQELTDVPTVEQFLEMRRRLKMPVTDPRGIRSLTRLALFETLGGSALRISALLTLRKKHLRLNGIRPYIMLVANECSVKGKSAGAIPLSPYAASILASHVRASGLVDNDLVFDLSQSVVRKILDSVAPTGLKMKPHSLRHFCCALLYFRNHDGGKADIIYVRDAAGHSNVSTTDGYLKLARRVVQTDEQWNAWANGKELSNDTRRSEVIVPGQALQAAG